MWLEAEELAWMHQARPEKIHGWPESDTTFESEQSQCLKHTPRQILPRELPIPDWNVHLLRRGRSWPSFLFFISGFQNILRAALYTLLVAFGRVQGARMGSQSLTLPPHPGFKCHSPALVYWILGIACGSCGFVAQKVLLLKQDCKPLVHTVIYKKKKRN